MESSIIQGLALDTVKTFESESIDCVITSPPYYQLRDYGFSEQWGLEKSYTDYLDNMVSLMGELKRVLKPTGTMWVNLGDSFNGNKQGNTDNKISDVVNEARIDKRLQPMPEKSLMLIPHRFAIRCIDELGLILRNDIIWAKPNGMPESVTDRFSKKHEFIFFFVKSKKYYFDLDSVRDKSEYREQDKPKRTDKIVRSVGISENSTLRNYNPNGKNPGDVSDFWAITTKPNSSNHYASYNSQLIDKPIVAGCPKNGVILDPFCGTGTTLVRAMQLERKGIGIEGNPEYVKIAERNIEPYLTQTNLFKVA